MEEEEVHSRKQIPVKEKGRDEQGGGGGWGFASLSVFTDLQKAAEEISWNAVTVVKGAAKGIADLHTAAVASPSLSGEDGAKAETSLRSTSDEEDAVVGEDNNLCKAALDRLEKASEDSLFGQGLKVLDSSIEVFASGAWSALGSALKGGSDLVQKLEHSAANLTHTIQHHGLPIKADSLAPSIIETGRCFTAKGMQVLEQVGKETMELLIAETGLDVEKNTKEVNQQVDEGQLEEVSFDRCFYIYGGPEQLEELEALSSHHSLLFNRRKAKLSSEQKSFYDGRLKQVQQLFILGTEMDDNILGMDKGKDIETTDDTDGMEMKVLCDASASKAADMAAGFTNALGGLGMSEITQRTTDRLESVHSEFVHRLSELCCLAVSQLLMLGKSIISNANKLKGEAVENNLQISWPEDSSLQALIISSKAKTMSSDIVAVSNCFTAVGNFCLSIIKVPPVGTVEANMDASEIACISEIIAAYEDATRSDSSGTHKSAHQGNWIQEKANAISNLIQADQNTALSKIQDGLQYLANVIVSTSMPSV